MQWTSRKTRLGAIGVALAPGVLVFAGVMEGQTPRQAKDAIGAEQALYVVHCVSCHGIDGKGDGEASNLMFPRPRDFTQGLFKLRSTPAGSQPSDEDLLATITRGIPGSAMPSFSFLSESDRRALVRRVQELTQNPTEEARRKEPPVDISARPARRPAVVAAGKALYAKLGCAVCHGPGGRGAEVVENLRDDAGFPIRAPDLTTGPFKGGSAASDIYLRLSTGMEGTPMVGQTHLSREDRWALAYYVESLFMAPRRGAALTTGALISPRAKVTLPKNDPFASAWRNAPKLRVTLNSLWNRSAPPELIVRSLHDGKTIAFLLEWADATRDTRTVLPEDFRDSIAIQFFAGAEFPSIAMGNRDTEVILWQWKADWQEHIDKGRRTGPTHVHPWMVDEPPYPLPTKAALDVNNQNAFVERSSPVEEATARGFDALAPKPLSEQKVIGKGVWREGRWHVALSRKLTPNSGITAGGGETKLGFAIWNGSERDRGPQKAVSAWHTLVMENNASSRSATQSRTGYRKPKL